MWLGNQPIHGCENVLILSGGDLLFLKTDRKENGTEIRKDVETLSKAAFFKKYQWPDNESGEGLYRELKNSNMNVNQQA
ncbi:MAG: hypothetical protein C4542_00700 [Dehalococcoidia bacterium]|nr:MAG: hypothetical protein C4542_00700 [Dehalococcoidia bacterium]